jgi:serine phosphatase RsbU (regulator of sigma subunit)
MFFFVLAIIFAASTTDFLISRYAHRSIFEQLRVKLMSIAQTAAVSVDTQALEMIPLNKEGMAAPQYKSIADNLKKIKESVPSVKYIYILTRTERPDTLQFIVDAAANQEEEDSKAVPGEKYDASRFPEMINAFSAATADRSLESDQWGVFLSGYAPIRDKDGKAIAILGVDMLAQDVYAVQQQVRRRAFYVFLLGLTLSLMLGFFISVSVSKQVRALTRGAQRVARGDLDYEVHVHGSDEIAQLGHLFNKMSADLKGHIEQLKRTTAEKERLIREIEIAREIQQSFLPEANPDIKGIQIAAMSLPARMVGGDFYDFIRMDKDTWGLAIADVSGKGIPSALFMALSRALMRASATVALSPGKTLDHANILIRQDSKSSMFVTLFYAILDSRTMSLKYANAGHNPPLFVSGPDYDIALLRAETMPLGVIDNIEATTQEVMLLKDDVVVLYTDGVTEAVNTKNEQFELERLERIVKDNRRLSADELMRKIEADLKQFVGKQPQFDDITIMIIKAT